MKKLAILSLSAVAAASAFVGCNSDDTTYQEYTSTNVIVSSFSLSADDNVLSSLDTVDFSIDLVGHRIFNADSLPYGTKTNKLVPVIKVYESASAMTLTVRRPNGTDTVYNYAENPNDTIDFSNGPVSLEVTSYDGTNKYRYDVSINVHKEIGDTMVWTKASFTDLPTAIPAPTAQKTVRNSKGLYTLTTDGTTFSLMHAERPDASWESVNTTIPGGADVSSFCASDNIFFILAAGQLYTSTDASAWTATGQMWEYIYGVYADHALGATRISGDWKFARYPSRIAPVDMPEGMPVRGTSALFEKSTSTAEFPMAFFVGGELPDGTLSNKTWAFDGTEWADVSLQPLPVAMKGITLVPFYNYLNKAESSKIPAILAYGGTDGTKASRIVYMTYDYGMTWYKAPVSMQLPEDVPAIYNAQAFTFESTFESRSAGWQPIDLGYRIPATAVATPWLQTSAGRATVPVTSWNVPFVYTFGGIMDNGKLSTILWRATINRLTFKPII